MIYVLVFCMVMLFMISYMLFKDLFHPCVIFCACYTLSTFFAMLNRKKWNVNLHGNTVFIIVLGAIIFIVVSLFVQNSRLRLKRRHGKCTQEVILVNSVITYIICIVQIIYIIRGYSYIVGFSNGNGSLSQMIGGARAASVSDIDSGNIVWNLIGRVSTYSAYIYAYIIINNVVGFKLKLRSNLLYFLPIILWAWGNIYYGGRYIYLTLLFAILVMVALVRNRLQYRKRFLPISQVFKYIIVAMAALYVFYGLASLVGRGTEKSIFDYISHYTGRAIHLFDIYMQRPIRNHKLLGGETFYYFYKTLYRLGIIGDENIGTFYLEMRSSGGVVLGNIYTAYRRWFSDFGIYGCFVFQGIFSFAYSYFYKKLLDGDSGNFMLMFYASMINAVFLHYADEMFFSHICNPTFYIDTLIFYVLYLVIFKVKLTVSNSYVNESGMAIH